MSALKPNSDFLNDKSELTNETPASNTDGKKRRTKLEIEMAKFPEYYALNEYQRKCLATNNYWRVMNGEPIVEVPPSDKHYHHYFDKRCYEIAGEYQEKLKRGKQGNNNFNTKIISNDPKCDVEPPQVINTNKDNTEKDSIKPSVHGKSKIEANKNQKEKKTGVVKSEQPKPEKNKEHKENSENKTKINSDTKCDFEIEEITYEAVKRFPNTISKLEDKKNDEPQLSLF